MSKLVWRAVNGVGSNKHQADKSAMHDMFGGIGGYIPGEDRRQLG
jgi:hypothetical protein